MIAKIIMMFALAPTPVARREVANTVFNYLFKYCVRDEFDPSQFAYDECYDLHWAAKEIYNTRRDIDTISCPKSDFQKGAFTPYSVQNYLRHGSMMFDIETLLPRCRPPLLEGMFL